MNATSCEQAIRELAYKKWQAAGSPPGSGEQFWLEAEAEVKKSTKATSSQCSVHDDDES